MIFVTGVVLVRCNLVHLQKNALSLLSKGVCLPYLFLLNLCLLNNYSANWQAHKAIPDSDGALA
jgi:hypothetical protein